MFRILDKVVSSVIEEVEEFVDDPVGKVVEKTLQPVKDGIDVLEGMSEGELRLEAALRLGADIASGMAVSEIIEMLSE